MKDLSKIVNQEEIRKTKTSHIVDSIQKTDYQRKPVEELMKCNKRETKTLLIARFGMLECGKNYQGTMNIICPECGVTDDEYHRLNDCIKFDDVNFCTAETKVNFQMIYTHEVEMLKNLAQDISRVWNTRNSHGTMNTY